MPPKSETPRESSDATLPPIPMHRSAALPVLILPVHHGGALLERCLNGLRLAATSFSRIVISLNGDYAQIDRMAVLSRLGGAQHLTILQTPTTLSPMAHHCWITEQLVHMAPNQRVLLLAHDDEINVGDLQRWADTLDQRSLWDAWLGSYKIRHADGSTSLVASAPSGGSSKPMLPEEWLSHYIPRPTLHLFTNMSGLSVPFAVYAATTRFIRLTGGQKGLRFELMLLTHKRISQIAANAAPLVTIHEHSQQEGKNVNRIDCYSDELRCMLWLVWNVTGVAALYRLLGSPWGLRHFCVTAARLVREYIHLGLTGKRRLVN